MTFNQQIPYLLCLGHLVVSALPQSACPFDLPAKKVVIVKKLKKMLIGYLEQIPLFLERFSPRAASFLVRHLRNPLWFLVSALSPFLFSSLSLLLC